MNSKIAANQLATRPADERFSSLAEIYAHASKDLTNWREATITADRLQVVAHDGQIKLQGRERPARLTNWAFGQIARLAGAPATYLQTLPAEISVQALSHSLAQSEPVKAKATHLMAADLGTPTDPLVTAITTDSYARLMDATVIAGVQARIGHGAPTDGGSWQLPMTWAGTHAGAYRGDRDLFLFLVDGGSIVDDPTVSWADASKGGGKLFRGRIIRNSQVGATSLSVEEFLFRVVCGNHIIWGIQDRSKASRRHVGTAGSVRDRMDQMLDQAFGPAPAEFGEIPAMIAKLNSQELGKDRDEVIQVGRKAGLTGKVAEASYDRAEQTESNPRSVWGFTQGITRVSQDLPYQDARQDLDLIAGAMIAAWRTKLESRVTV